MQYHKSRNMLLLNLVLSVAALDLASAQNVEYSEIFSVTGALISGFYSIGAPTDPLILVETRSIVRDGRGITIHLLRFNPEGLIVDAVQHSMPIVASSSGIRVNLSAIDGGVRLDNGNYCLLGSSATGSKLLLLNADGSVASITDIEGELLNLAMPEIYSAEKAMRPPIIQFTRIKSLTASKIILLGWMRQYLINGTVTHTALGLVCDSNLAPLTMLRRDYSDKEAPLGDMEVYEMWDAVQAEDERVVCVAAPRRGVFDKAVEHANILVLEYDGSGKLLRERRIMGYAPILYKNNNQLAVIYDSEIQGDKLMLTQAPLDVDLYTQSTNIIYAADYSGRCLQYNYGVGRHGASHIAHIAIEGLPLAEDQNHRNEIVLLGVNAEGQQQWRYEADASKALGVDISSTEKGSNTTLLLWKERIRMGRGKNDQLRIEVIKHP